MAASISYAATTVASQSTSSSLETLGGDLSISERVASVSKTSLAQVVETRLQVEKVCKLGRERCRAIANDFVKEFVKKDPAAEEVAAENLEPILEHMNTLFEGRRKLPRGDESFEDLVQDVLPLFRDSGVQKHFKALYPLLIEELQDVMEEDTWYGRVLKFLLTTPRGRIVLLGLNALLIAGIELILRTIGAQKLG